MVTYDSVLVFENLSDAVATYNGNEYVNNLRNDYALLPTGEELSYNESWTDTYKSPVDRESFSQIVKSGRIKMTDYSHYKKETNLLLAEIPRLFANRAGVVADWNGSSWSYKDFDEQLGRYSSIIDGARIFNYYDHKPFTVTDRKNEVMQSIVEDAAKSLDLLTEFAERRETIELLAQLLKAAVRPTQAYKDAVDWVKRNIKNKQKAAEAIGGLWLKYRYAIMPIVYSIKDAMELLEKQNRLYLKDTAKRDAYGEFPEPERDILYDTGSYHIQWSGVTKARFVGESYTLADLLGFNPFVTAWELTKLSFVIDWFLNIGGWIEAQTFGLFDFSEERKFCVSTKVVANIETKLHASPAFLPESEIWNSYGGGTLVHTFPAVSSNDPGVQTVKRYTEESYVREVFSPSDVELDLSPFLNWKRWLDALALLIRPVNSRLRSLKS